MPLLIKNGDIVTADARFRGDIYAEGETITRMGVDLDAPPGTEELDARGKLVFPGFIDPHVHVYLPFMATFAKDTHETASVAALVGGTTTFIEMCCPSRNEDALKGYELWKAKAEGHSACDYTFHMSVTRWDEGTEGQLREIVGDGITSFKIFLAYKNFFGVDDGEMYQALRLAQQLGVITTAHCENAELVGRLQQSLLAQGKTGPQWHEPSRPESVEAEGTGRFATFLENTGATGYVVHLSCEPALQAARAAKARGVKLFVEAVVPHLLLDKSYAERPGLEGMKHVMSPPLRDRRNQQVLWSALANGDIDTVGTDHCPFDMRAEIAGQGRVHADSEWNSRDRRSRKFAVHVWSEARATGSAPVCGSCQHQSGEIVRVVPAQGHDCSGQRRGLDDLRSGVPGRDFRSDAQREQRLQRV